MYVKALDIGTWPRKWRLLFLFTLPVSLPLYIIAHALTLLVLLVLLVTTGLACSLCYLWVGKARWEQERVR